jgi:hypothetical protein
MMESKVPQSHFVRHVDVMAINNKPAKNVHKIQLAICTRVHMLIQRQQLLICVMPEYSFFASQNASTHQPYTSYKRESNHGQPAKIRPSSGLRTLHQFQHDTEIADGKAGPYGVSGQEQRKSRQNF